MAFNENHQTEASAVAAIAEKGVLPTIVTIRHPEGGDDIQVLSTKDGLKSIRALQDERRTAPERRTGIARVTDLESFIAHTKRFADDDSALFANDSPTAPAIETIFDYHRAGAEGAPRFGGHRTIYSFPLSKEWKAWGAANGVAMGQREFAEFLEERLGDVVDPSSAGESAKAFATTLGFQLASPGRLLEVAKGLSISVGNRVANHVNLSSGEVELHFSTTHQDASGKQIQVPSAFIVALPVFERGDLFQIGVRLRYRVVEGQVFWTLALHRSERVFDFAFNEAVNKAQQETGLPLFHGASEK